MTLWLAGNQISDIKPLVDNSGIDNGDTVSLCRNNKTNPLSTTSSDTYIPRLQTRGVTVQYAKSVWDCD